MQRQLCCQWGPPRLRGQLELLPSCQKIFLYMTSLRCASHAAALGHPTLCVIVACLTLQRVLFRHNCWQGGGNNACHGGLQAVEKMAKDFKARVTVRLAVAGAFHTHFMKPAEEKLRCAACPVHSCFTPVEQASCVSKCCSLPCLLLLPSLNGIGNTNSVNFESSCLKTLDWLLRLCSAVREALASTQIVEPRIPVVSNVDAKAHSDPEAIRDILARQVNTCNP